VFAMFDKRSKKLTFVNLQLADPKKGNQLIGELRAKYGKSFCENYSTFMGTVSGKITCPFVTSQVSPLA
jgi:hypothetical protein